MSPETLFSICNTAVLPGWLLLVVAPRWKWTKIIINSCLLPLLLAVVYLFLIVTHFGQTEGGFGSLADVAKLFQNPHILLAGWIHYLAFDLFVGSWEVRDAERHRINHLLVIPCLILTFLLGPIGLLLYFILRWTLRQKFLIEE
ncbi:MAG: ABA4-like family protein [Acidobacteriota bacterium]|nr:ABA4-like family protein [Acidobacteriota bacterium]